MTTSTSMTAAARRHFDQGMALLAAEPDAALAKFRDATDTDPAMADAWLGRIAAGDDALGTLQELYAYGRGCTAKPTGSARRWPPTSRPAPIWRSR